MQFSLHSRPAGTPPSEWYADAAYQNKNHTANSEMLNIFLLGYFQRICLHCRPSASYILQQKQNDFFLPAQKYFSNVSQDEYFAALQVEAIFVVACKVLIGGTQFIWREILNGKMFTQDAETGEIVSHK